MGPTARLRQDHRLTVSRSVLPELDGYALGAAVLVARVIPGFFDGQTAHDGGWIIGLVGLVGRRRLPQLHIAITANAAASVSGSIVLNNNRSQFFYLILLLLREIGFQIKMVKLLDTLIK